MSMLPVTVGANPYIRSGQMIRFVCRPIIRCDAGQAQHTLGELLPRFLRGEYLAGQLFPTQFRILFHRPGKQRGEIPIASLAEPFLPVWFPIGGSIAAVLLIRIGTDTGKAKCTMLVVPIFSIRAIGTDITEFCIMYIIPRAILQTPIRLKQ